MKLDFLFFVQNLLLGVGLAMDAFSVSLANGLSEPCMKKHRMCGIAGLFALFQGLMPMIGWICVHTIVKYFRFFETLIPWIALGLLGFIGGKMLVEGIKNKSEPCECTTVCFGALFLQGIATSIDALSVGFTIADYDLHAAILAVAMIAAVTFAICLLGLLIGRQVGTKISGKAGILGGAILIFIGLEIFITSWF